MKVLTVGGAMIDTIAIIESDRIERMTMLNADSSFLLLEEGRKTEALEISTHWGGGAVNAAVSMARLGLDVAALVKLGKDERAETIMARLLAEGVSTRWALRDGRQPTGASVLLSSHERNAAVFTFRGANTLLEPQDLRPDAFAVDLLYIANLSNRSADCFPLLIEKAKANNALVAANPGVRQLSARGTAFLEALSRIDILSINRTEAGILVPALIGRFGERKGPLLSIEPGETPPPLILRGLTGGGFDMDIGAFFAALRKLGPSHVVVTDGRGGAFLGLKEAVLHCPVLETNVAGTAGAGDAFTSTFAAFIAQARAPEEALRAASLNAGSVVGYVDTQSGLLARDALEERLGKATEMLPLRRWAV
jgi:ribokinase